MADSMKMSKLWRLLILLSYVQTLQGQDKLLIAFKNAARFVQTATQA